VLEELDVGEHRSDDQNLRGDLSPYIFIGFVSLSATEVQSCAANAGLSIKEGDSVASLNEPAVHGCSMMCWLLERLS
jgi:hypothetical protein